MALKYSDDVDNIEKLKTAEDFALWKFQIDIIFKSHDLYKLVSGKEVLAVDATEMVKADFERRDARAQKVITSTIDKKSLTYIMSCSTAKDMYGKICSIYDRDSEDRKCALLQEFFNYKFDKDSDLATHISKLQNVTYKLKSLNQDINDDMVISKILSTLPDNYKFFASAWESTQKNDRTLDNLTSRLLLEEMRQKSKDKEEAVAFKTIKDKDEEYRCKKCNKVGHLTRSCKYNNYNNSMKCFKCNQIGHIAKNCNRVFCKICKKNNHTEKDCFFRKRQVEDKSKNATVSFLTCSDLDHNKDRINSHWIVDSGATTHLTNDKTLLTDCKETDIKILVAKDKACMYANVTGKVKTKDVILNDVLYVPELTKNLLSVKAITERGGQIKFNENRVEIFKDKIKIMEGKKNENGLYEIQLKNEEILIAESTDSIRELHAKLGHLPIEKMKKLTKLADGIKIITDSDIKEFDKTCETCLKARQTRRPFLTQRQRATRPLQIIHTDICGPIDPLTWDNKRYFITFLDDYTHFSMVFLMERKNEAVEIIKQYVKEVENKWNNKVYTLRCDNGGEYANVDLKQWCKFKGIVLDFTTPYTPQLNGKAERLNRTIMEKARALIAENKTKKNMWGEAVRTAVYLLNRSPTETVETTAVEKWTNKKPNLSGLAIFGNTAHAKVVSPLKKLDDRTKEYIFIGYAPNGYRLWDSNKQEVIIARDVVFKKYKENKIEVEQSETQVKINAFEENEEESIIESNNQIDDNVDDLDGRNENEEIRNSKRIRKPPQRFDDYVLLTYEEAVTSADKEKWIEAIKKEKEALNKNNTWTYVNETELGNNKLLSNRWVFRIKDDGRYKARLVVCGNQQEYGIDYTETYSPVVNIASLRALLAIAASKKYHMCGFDVKTAFLYGELDETIFMKLPKGFEKEKKICKLKKSLYGLKQSPMNWNKKFTIFMQNNGFEEIKTERCIFKNKNSTMIIAIYVDDGLIMGNNEKEIKQFLKKLEKEFDITIEDELSNFIGIEIKTTEDGIEIKQEKYIENVLEKYDMTESKPMSTPIEIKQMMTNDQEKEQKFPYRESVGSLLYASNKTRPDIAYAVGYESRFADKTKNQDIANVKRTLRYLNGTRDWGIKYSKNGKLDCIEAYSDSDFAGDQETRRSTTGYILMYCEGPIAWCSRRQPIIALSTAEAELIAAAECAKEVLYFKSFLGEVLNQSVGVTLKIDNQSAIKIIKNGSFNKRSKHIDVRYKFICEKVDNKEISIEYCSTRNQIADIFTKSLNKTTFEKFKNNIMSKL